MSTTVHNMSWREQLPVTWDITRIGDVVPITSSKRVFEEEWTSEGIPFYRAREIVLLSKEGHVNNQLFITKDKYKELKSISGIPKIGDILVTGVGTLGITYVVNSESPFYFKDGNLIWLKLNTKLNCYFLNYLFKSAVIKEQIINSAPGTTVGTYTITTAKKTEIPFPSLVEQTAIATYLDTQTTRIDRKISILEQKFDKLEEYKQSVIFEAVTKGLDSNVPMKDSGIEWIGEIPKHWEVSRLKNIAIIKKGEVFDDKKAVEDGLYPYINGGINPSDWSNVFNSYENTIAVSEGGASAGYTQFMKTRYWAGSHCYKIQSKNPTTDSKYVYYVLKGFEKNLMSEKTGSAMPNLQKTRFINYVVSFVTNLDEQISIVSYLDTKCSTIDKQKTLIKKKIELLKEYKQAVIYEAVTGKMNIV